jgi:hypothetical protein
VRDLVQYGIKTYRLISLSGLHSYIFFMRTVVGMLKGVGDITNNKYSIIWIQ